jgi:hypothetical protein
MLLVMHSFFYIVWYWNDMLYHDPIILFLIVMILSDMNITVYVQ